MGKKKELKWDGDTCMNKKVIHGQVLRAEKRIGDVKYYGVTYGPGQIGGMVPYYSKPFDLHSEAKEWVEKN